MVVDRMPSFLRKLGKSLLMIQNQLTTNWNSFLVGLLEINVVRNFWKIIQQRLSRTIKALLSLALLHILKETSSVEVGGDYTQKYLFDFMHSHF